MADPEFDRNSVRDFYDDFLDERMVSYRVRGNPRIQYASEFLVELTHERSRILDVGCGIGIVTERLARAAPKGKAFGVDLSEKNVWYAQRTCSERNLEFSVADVLSPEGRALLEAKGPYDLITLVDVIEHIPAALVAGFIRSLSSLLSPSGRIAMTFPTPSYQHYLRSNEPEELQPVDEDVTLSTLESASAECGMVVEHYARRSVWMTQQYAHCVLAFESLEPVSPDRSLRRRARRWVSRKLVEPLRQWRYVDRVFRDE